MSSKSVHLYSDNVEKMQTQMFSGTLTIGVAARGVLIQGSGFTHRQIILQLMVVLSCRLTMGYHSSCVSIQM